MSRQQERVAFDTATRIALLEHDIDQFEDSMDHLRDELKAMNRILTGILISIATAAVLLAINIAVGSVG